MAQGISLEQTFPGPAKLVLPKADKGTDWEVNNYEGAHYGPISLLRATAESVNTVYAQLVTRVGPEKVVEMARRLGIKSELSPHASIALGTAEVSVLDMAGAFLTFQSKGMQIEPRVIRRITQNDSVLVDDKPKATRVLDRVAAEKVSYALQQVVDEGSGMAAALPQAQVWGKTGTTEGYGDAWFVGYTRQFTTAVWMGNPEGPAKPLHNVHGVSRVNGGSLPAQIFNRYMSKANPPDDTPPDKVPDLTGRTVAPVASIASSGSSSSSGFRSTTTVVEEEEEVEAEESPSTTAQPTTASTQPSIVTVPTTAPPVVTTQATTPASTAPRSRPTVTFTIPERP
jgi:penicillin-binding protein 1A